MTEKARLLEGYKKWQSEADAELKKSWALESILAYVGGGPEPDSNELELIFDGLSETFKDMNSHLSNAIHFLRQMAAQLDDDGSQKPTGEVQS